GNLRHFQNDEYLFEMLVLEGAQAGLSWLTILKRREEYRKAFDGFNPAAVAQYDEEKKGELLQNKGIIRNRRKIESAIKNARAFLKVQAEFGSFHVFYGTFLTGNRLLITGKSRKRFRLRQKNPSG